MAKLFITRHPKEWLALWKKHKKCKSKLSLEQTKAHFHIFIYLFILSLTPSSKINYNFYLCLDCFIYVIPTSLQQLQCAA